MTPPSGGCTNRVTPPVSAARSASGDGEPSGPARRAHRSTRPGSTARPSASMRRSAWNPAGATSTAATWPSAMYRSARRSTPAAGSISLPLVMCSLMRAPGASVRPSESDKRRSAASRSACSSASRSWPARANAASNATSASMPACSPAADSSNASDRARPAPGAEPIAGGVIARRRQSPGGDGLGAQRQQDDDIGIAQPLVQRAEREHAELRQALGQQRRRRGHAQLGHAQCGERVDQGAGQARMAHVAHQRDGQPRQVWLGAQDGAQERQRGQRIGMDAVARIQDAQAGAAA